LPSVNRLYTEFKGQGLEVLQINIREGADLVKRTVRERGYVAPVVLDHTGDVAGKAYGVWGTPTVYLINRQGQLIGRMVGARDWNRPEARDLIRALLQEDAKS